VYKWGEDKVVKLYFDKFKEDWIKREANIGRILHEAGLPTPAVFETIEIGGRRGIIQERIFGRTVLSLLETEPWKLYHFAHKMAGLHFKIHEKSVDGIPSQKERFMYTIKLSANILGDKVKLILDYLDKLPDGNNVCHGDMHFNNIIVSNNKFVAVDWSSAYKGNPLGDVARTCLIINSPSIFSTIPDPITLTILYSKWLAYLSYLNEYIRLSNVKFEDIDAWMLPAAAAKLKDKIPGEEKWLMKIINQRLEQLGV
ncbi:MAG TPA: aminoglycoside phosphotransferase family protein, partial [Clostridia bacterium]